MLSGMLKREFAMASGVLCERLQAAARETGGKLSTSIGEHCKSQCCGKWVQYFYVLAFDTRAQASRQVHCHWWYIPSSSLVS